MRLPFSVEDFLEVFHRYNEGVWPIEIVLFLVAIAIIGLALRRTRRSGEWIGGLLAALWLWMGVVYHWRYFTTINQAAYVFGALFVVEAGLLLSAVLRHRLSFRVRLDVFGITGGVLIAYALLIYPLAGRAAGHIYPASPTFGLPCPTTIFTFGLLLWSERGMPLRIVAIPVIWSLIGSVAAFSLTIVEDYGLLAAGLAGAALLIGKNHLRKAA